MGLKPVTVCTAVRIEAVLSKELIWNNKWNVLWIKNQQSDASQMFSSHTFIWVEVILSVWYTIKLSQKSTAFLREILNVFIYKVDK